MSRELRYYAKHAGTTSLATAALLQALSTYTEFPIPPSLVFYVSLLTGLVDILMLRCQKCQFKNKKTPKH